MTIFSNNCPGRYSKVMEDWRSVLEDNEWWWRDIGKRFSLFLRLSNWKSSSFNSIKSTELQVRGGSRKKHRECDHYERKLKLIELQFVGPVLDKN